MMCPSGHFSRGRVSFVVALSVFTALILPYSGLLYASPKEASHRPEAVGKLKQQRIRGTIKDEETGQPISGVTIAVLGKGRAAVSDEKGEFELDVNLNEELEIKHLSYKSFRVKLIDFAALDIKLQPFSDNLETVVVTGYGAQRRKDLTGAVAIVDPVQIKSVPVASPISALQGRATGVQVVNDGAPGSTPQIKIRGYSTINNNEPLYIIDGVPFEGKLSWLSANDIETMQVLKDASSASIYGARANNGVIIITTKSGKVGMTQMNFASYVGLQVPVSGSFPKMMSPQQVYDLNNALTGKEEKLPDYLLAGTKGYAENALISAADVDMSKYNYSNNPETFYQITKANKAGTNWFKELSQRAPVQNYELNASGATDQSAYTFSLGSLKQKGAMVHSGFERFTARSNTRFKALDGKLRMGENMQFSYTKGVGIGVNPNTAGGYMGDGSLIAFAYRIQNIIPVYDEGGNFAGSKGGWGNGENPVSMAYRGKDNYQKTSLFFGNAYAEYDILRGLMFRTSFGLQYETANARNISYPNPEFSEGSFNSGLSESNRVGTEWTWTNTLNYRGSWEAHSLNVLAGMEAIDSRFRNLSASRNGFFTLDNLDYFYLDVGNSNIGNGSNGGLSALYSIFGKVDYSYDDRYILSATLRRDGSSNFGANNRFGLFPGVSGAWRLSNEAFLKDVSWLSDLKLRVGYGVTGNQRIPAFQYLNRYQAQQAYSAYPIDGTPVIGLWQRSYRNPDVKWEQVNALNVGLDFTLFKGVFDGSLDYYDKQTKNMLFRVPLPAVEVGLAESPYVNVGSMQNRGLELALAYHYGKNDPKPFALDVTGTLSRNVNKVLSLAPNVNSQIYGNFRNMQTTILQPGQPFGAFYGYEVTGIYQDAAAVENSPSYAGARPGGLKYKDVNGDGRITDADRKVIGSPHPDFVYSLGLNATYKNFDANLFFYGSQGNKVFEGTRYFTDFSAFSGQKSQRLLDAWRPDNPGSSTPSPILNASSFEYASSSYYVQDASFLKLKNLQLGYNFPLRLLGGERAKVKSLRLYFMVTNVFTLTKYTGLDPEVSATSSDYPALGVDFGVYPQARQYSFGLNLGL